MNKIIFKGGLNNYEFIHEHIKGHLYTNKKIVVFIDGLPVQEKNKDEIWIFIQVESYYVLGYLYSDLHKYEFDMILTFIDGWYNKKKYFKFFPYNKVYWVKPDFNLKENLNLPNVSPIAYKICDKKFQISMLCGSKNWCPGHIFRRECWNYQNKIEIPKKFMYSHSNEGLKIFEDNKKISHSKDKTELFIDSMFHIAIENNKAINYFTEKLIDCFVSKTIPIYWGCPNIGDFFNLDGMIILDNIKDLKLINNLSKQFYIDRIEFIEDNYNRVLNRPSFKEQFISIVGDEYDIDIIEK